jgi:hypothetical protein
MVSLAESQDFDYLFSKLCRELRQFISFFARSALYSSNVMDSILTKACRFPNSAMP